MIEPIWIVVNLLLTYGLHDLYELTAHAVPAGPAFEVSASWHSIMIQRFSHMIQTGNRFLIYMTCARWVLAGRL